MSEGDLCFWLSFGFGVYLGLYLGAWASRYDQRRRLDDE